MAVLRRVAIAALCSLAVPAIAAAQQTGPSFDCKAARTKPEKAICASPALSALDRRIAGAYGKAMAAFDPATRTALRSDQRLFLDARNEMFGSPYYEMKEDLQARATMLESLDLSPRPGWQGDWVGVMGEIRLTPKGTAWTAHISTVALTMSQPVCILDAGAKADGNALVVGGSPAERKENEGWTVRLARDGALLSAELMPPGGDYAGGPPFCGNRTSIDGTFFPAKSARTPQP